MSRISDEVIVGVIVTWYAGSERALFTLAGLDFLKPPFVLTPTKSRHAKEPEGFGFIDPSKFVWKPGDTGVR